MKKFLSLIVMAILLVTLVVPSFALFKAEEDVLNVKFDVQKATTAWKGDGVISDGEYYKIDAKNTWFSAAVAADANIDYEKNLMPEFYMSWDETYVYFASVVTFKTYENKWDADPGSMWQSGAMQMNYAEPNQTDPAYRLEYGVGLSSDTGALMTFNWADGMGSAYDALANKDFFIVNNNNVVTYEVRTPWTSFLAKPAVAEGSTFGACYVWSVGTGTDYIHTQLASGCTGDPGKNAGNFAQLKLVVAPVVETAAPTTEAPATTTDTTAAAQTADVAGIAVFAALIALAGVVVATKKRG
jgi:hypothetical protein